MAESILMPQMGYDVTQAKIVRWLKNVGDPVRKGEAVAEIETDKVTIEIEAFRDGTLTEILVPTGELVPVGTPIATLDTDKGAEKSAEKPLEKSVRETAPPGAPATPAATEAKREAATSAAPPAPAATTAKAEANVTLPEPEKVVQPDQTTEPPVAPGPQNAAAPAVPAAPGARGVSGSIAPAPGRVDDDGHRRPVSPAARKIAEASGVDVSSITGTGPGGRVTREDVEHALERRSSPPASAASTASRPAGEATAAPTRQAAPRRERGGTNRPLSALRQTVARRMVASKRNAPHFYVTVEVDVTDALKLRVLANQGRAEDERITVNDLIVAAAARALPNSPEMNATYADDHIVVYGQVDIGIAVPLDAGLITVVIRDADQKSLVDLARETKDIVGRARIGKLKPDEFGAGTFTVSNLGPFGVESFIAIVNPPQAAILAVGSALKRPLWIDDAFVPRDVMKLTVSVDHRVADGATAARYLGEVRKLLEQPGLLL